MSSRLYPELERDMAALERKQRTRAKKRQIQRRIGGGVAGLWLAIVILIASSGLHEGTLPYILAGIGIATTLFIAFGLLIWGCVTFMMALDNNEL